MWSLTWTPESTILTSYLEDLSRIYMKKTRFCEMDIAYRSRRKHLEANRARSNENKQKKLERKKGLFFIWGGSRAERVCVEDQEELKWDSIMWSKS